MAGGGGDVVPVSPRAEQPAAKKRRAAGRRHQAQAATSLPLDVIVEIAARSNAATLVRCAATCRDARRRIAEDPNLRGHLRLCDTGPFLLPLLRGHLAGIDTYDDYGNKKTIVYLVDTTAADDTHLDLVDETFRDVVPVDSRGGLVLVRATATATAHPWPWHHDQLVVCNLTTRCHLALPPEPAFPLHPDRSTDVQYVLLGGDSDGEGGTAVGRPFQVLMVELVLSKRRRCERRLLVHTFSSEHGAWSPLTEIPTPNLQGSGDLHPRPLVVGDVVHWLCLTDSKSYGLMLHVKAAWVIEMALPASFPRDGKKKNYRSCDERHHYLLATASAGGNPIVLVADAFKISAWEQSKHTKVWKPRPQEYLLATASAGGNPIVLVADADKIFAWDQSKQSKLWKPRAQVIMETQAIALAKNYVPDLVCFAERSGVVLLRIYGCRFFWLDLHSKNIVRFTPRIVRCHTHKCIVPTRWILRFECQHSVELVPFNSLTDIQ